ncbi:alpha/beta hydrolase [Aldersonia sp. NBC_00410]|uniref:alpha/beta fold hydrolase n=1 Tax=Aldersonia sp. NBC_00410 TaxID=2975954 RepID=UPI002255E2A9|nr:alpha/beta hydrolase [Aldersonia sp. NBC_00410]MCX5041819.1 alpha/beta hydrolase [Aldersonia sp. NBC_00410]
MTKRTILTGLAIAAGAAGAIGVAAALRARGDDPPRGRYDDELLNTPALAPEVIEVTSDDGARLRVHAYGPADGDVIVLSHGWTCNIEYWYPQINALAGEYRVIAYDQRGHGGSEIGPKRFSTDLLADDLAAVLAAVVPEGRTAVIAGHSMGGMSIMAWAARYPDQVRRYAGAVLLANTGSHRLVPDSKLIPMPARAPAMPVIAGRMLLGAPLPLPRTKLVRAALQDRVMCRYATPEQVEFASNIIFDCPPRVRGKWGVVLSRLDLRAAFDHLDVPTSVLAGECDNLTPPVHAERLAEALEQAGVLDHFEVIPKTGHLSNIEAARRFNTELLRLAEKSRALVETG